MPHAVRTCGILAAALALGLGPSIAEARTHHRTNPQRHYATHSCRGSANTGTVVGAIGGGLLGHAVGGHGIGGTLVGAGVGGVAGHEIAKSNCRRHR